MSRTSKAVWETYRDFYQLSGPLSEHIFDSVWSGVQERLIYLIRKRTTKLCEFDREDLLSDVRTEIWLRMRDRNLPCDSLSVFNSALAKIVQQVVVDQYRTMLFAAKATRIYTECRESVYEECRVTELWANETRESRHERIAIAMVRKSRFVEVTVPLCKRIIRLLEREASLGVMLEALETSGFWDLGFLLEHMQVLYRWAYHELRCESLGWVA